VACGEKTIKLSSHSAFPSWAGGVTGLVEEFRGSLGGVVKHGASSIVFPIVDNSRYTYCIAIRFLARGETPPSFTGVTIELAREALTSPPQPDQF